MSSGVKKLVIKPFKALPKLPDNYEEVSWQRLKSAVDAVFEKTTTAISKEELYQVLLFFVKYNINTNDI